ncbi:hypothetical protein DICVIV_07336 [Dictyocaulus viviparus]|uniref:NF-kappa-B-activating protein C-terminal domain-containing protein n=2 Tax=Metastrongylidae TaxID=55271 RepID=A0A0D8XW50_DICVI|nr:hypothetical protein DICVIV_07336 [Dictyocaulus viviparus]
MPSSIAASSSPSDDSHVSKSKSVSRSPPFRYRRRVSSRSRGRQSSRSPRRRRRNTSRSSTSRSSERHFRSSRRNGKSPNRYSRSPIRRRRSRSSSRESESRRRRHQYTPRRYHSRESSRSRSTSPKKRNTRQRLISRSRSPPDPRDSFLFKRRSRRMLILERGAPEVWGRSPVQSEIEEVYAAYLECEENKRNEVLKVEKLKETRNIERRMEEKKRRADKSKKQDSDSDEWVEVTHDMRLEEAAREAKEEQEIPGPALPEHLQSRNQLGVHIKANYGKDMLKGEAAAMAAYAARGERIPRRGEIGLSSAEISEFEKVGYVMSGTRHKAMEATRLRKENQVLTAEEKRLLSGFSQEERKKKEMAMLGQMRSLIASKRVE